MMMEKLQRVMLAFVIAAMFTLTAGTASAQSVYVCKSKNAKVYHKTTSCAAIKKCKAGIATVKVGQAKSNKKRQCKACFGTAKKAKAIKSKKAVKAKTKTKPATKSRGIQTKAKKNRGKSATKTVK